MSITSNAAQEGLELAHYSTVAKILHWLIALLIIVQIPLGLAMASAPDAITKFKLFQLHKSFGITILLLAALRLAWRLFNKPPALPAAMRWFEKAGAHSTHFALYVLLFALPLTGWIIVSASKLPIPTLLFYTIPWPHISWITSLPAENKAAVEHSAKGIHELLANVLLVLVILHILAALYHGIFLRDGVLSRMAPSWRRRRNKVTAALAALVATACLLPLTATPAHAIEWSVKPDQSSVGFAATGGGYETKGNFGIYQCAIDFDPDTPQDTTVKVTLDMTSISTGQSDVDNTLATSDFFDPRKYPVATFMARGAKPLGGDKYALDGQLTLKGVTKPVGLVFTFKPQSGGTAKVSAEAKINRLDFGIGAETIGGIAIDKAVTLTINLTALRLDN